MEEKTTFTIDKEPLFELLKNVHTGEIQLPEFQRRWVWDDDHVKSILASVSLSYPIGAIMLLDAGNPDVRFKSILIEGVQYHNNIQKQPEQFVLDGQQRLTSLFQSLFINDPVKTKDIKKNPIERYYYIDIEKALDPNEDREESIISLPPDMKLKGFGHDMIEDYSGENAEFENSIFPFRKIFNSADWRKDYNKFWEYNEEKIKLFDQFESEVIKRFEQYLVPLIKISKQTPKDAICQIFEVVNTGGVELDVFELLTATFAADEYDLREDWEGKHDHKGMKTEKGRYDKLKKYKVLKGVASKDFLQVVTLLTTYERKKRQPESPVSCKKRDVLKLKLEDYKHWTDFATEGFFKAAEFLTEQHIFTERDIPYTTQLVPLSAIFTVLRDDVINAVYKKKIAQWYWCGVFGEMYGSAIETRFAKDLVEVVDWLKGGEEPGTVRDSYFNSSRLYTMKTRHSAAYKGLYTLLMREGCRDFITDVKIDLQTYFDKKIDIHHIFPKAYCNKIGIEAKIYDSIINKTPLSAETNRNIGGNAPSKYIGKIIIRYKTEENELDKIIASHIIDPALLKKDDFSAFFEKRKEELLKLIEKTTGKNVVRESEQEILQVLSHESEYSVEENDVA